MTQRYRFNAIDVSVPPSANTYKSYHVRRNRKTGKFFAQWYLTREAKDYIKTVQTIAYGAGWRPVPKPTQVSILLVWWRRSHRHDLENIQKVLLDALQGVGYENDSQITGIHAVRADDRTLIEDFVHVELSVLNDEQLEMEVGDGREDQTEAS